MCIEAPRSVEFQLFVRQTDKSMYCATLFAVNVFSIQTLQEI